MPALKGNKYASFNNTEKILQWKSKRNWIKDELTRFRAKRTIALYNRFRMQNNSSILTKDQTNELAATYRPDSNIPELSVKQFLNIPEVKSTADKYLMDICVENGITIPYLMQEKKDLIKLTKDNKQYGITLKTIESFENNLGLTQKIKVTEQRTYEQGDLSGINNVIDEATEAKRKVTVSTTVNNEQISNNEGDQNIEPDKESVT